MYRAAYEIGITKGNENVSLASSADSTSVSIMAGT